MTTHKELLLFITLLLMIVLSLTGCASKNGYDNLKGYPIEKIKTVKKSEKKAYLGMAFGGGGVRGFVHLGVIKALNEAGIKADMVTGTSAGSVAASLYATNLPYPDIEKIIMNLTQDDIADTVFSTKGIINGKALAAWMNKVTGNRNIEAMPIPLGIAVTDLISGQPLLIRKGNLGQAVQSSSSIPGAFIPVSSNGSLYVDGGVLALVPVRFAKAMGADIVIAIDVYCGKRVVPKDGALQTLYAAYRLQSCTLSSLELPEADIVIQSYYEPKDYGDFNVRMEAINEGYKATQKLLPKIRQLIDANH